MLKRLLWFTLFLLGYYSQLSAQYIVSRVDDGNASVSQDGFYFALPRTMLKVELLVEQSRKQRGPLADYADDFLGTTPLINVNSTAFRILDVKVIPEFEADPSQLYFVQFPADRSRDETSMAFSLSSQGTLLSFGDTELQAVPAGETVDQTLIFREGDEMFDYFPGYNRKKKIDTITRKITIDTVSIERFIFKTSWVDKSERDRAEEAAIQIEEIREARFNLLTGYQEVNYGESIKYMDFQLNELERQYLELFLGKETVSHRMETIFYAPAKGTTEAVLLQLENGQEVVIRISPSENTGNLPETPLSRIDNLYYRIPDMAGVEIEHDGEILFRGRFPVSQLGVVAPVPLGNATIHLDPLTGALTRISKK
ncbi:MAG: DUF4831 family protein [bacterium]